jgi:hypothetical protein
MICYYFEYFVIDFATVLTYFQDCFDSLVEVQMKDQYQKHIVEKYAVTLLRFFLKKILSFFPKKKHLFLYFS